MATTWNINQLDAYPEYEGNADVVFTVHWSITATEDEYVGYAYGSQSLTLGHESAFTPYNELTQKQVTDWVHDAMGQEQVAAYETVVMKQIDDAKNPPVINPPLPW